MDTKSSLGILEIGRFHMTYNLMETRNMNGSSKLSVKKTFTTTRTKLMFVSCDLSMNSYCKTQVIIKKWMSVR